MQNQIYPNPTGPTPIAGLGPVVPGQPFIQQPGTIPTNTTNIEPNGIPTGLEYLAQVDQLLIKQSVELFEMATGLETNNKYKIQNSMGQPVFTAKEKSSFFQRNCCGSDRGFKMSIFDNNNTGWSWIDVRSDAQKPRCSGAQVPRSPDAQKPRCPEAQMPRSPDAQKPKYPEAQMPRLMSRHTSI